MPLSKTIFVLSYSPGELSLVRGALRLVGWMVDNGSWWRVRLIRLGALFGIDCYALPSWAFFLGD
jgi:hypothetical protein